jgi:flagellar biosynthetic protein FliQ
MNDAVVVQVFQEAIYNILIMSAPMLLAALLVGLIISVFQATTQIQEQTLAFVPKLIAIFVVLMIAGPWLLSNIVEFTNKIFQMIPSFILK